MSALQHVWLAKQSTSANGAVAAHFTMGWFAMHALDCAPQSDPGEQQAGVPSLWLQQRWLALHITASNSWCGSSQMYAHALSLSMLAQLVAEQ